jgi:arylsulfatase
MRTRTTLAAAALLAAGAVLGWLAASGRIDAPPAIGQEKARKDVPSEKPLAGDSKQPNIVFVLMDNLGYGEVGCYGGGILRGAPTPRIDHLAAEGMRLLNFNVEAQCTPMTANGCDRGGAASRSAYGSAGLGSADCRCPVIRQVTCRQAPVPVRGPVNGRQNLYLHWTW